MGTSLESKQEMPLEKDWLCYSLNHNNPSKAIPIILIEHGPKNIVEIKKQIRNFDACIVFFVEKNILFFKTIDQSYSITLENDSELERIISILKSKNIANAKDEFAMMLAINNLINAAPNATGDFDNRGLFATNYLRSRIFDDSCTDVDAEISKIKAQIGKKPTEILESLGWNSSNHNEYDDKVSITITDQEDFSIRKKDTDVAPSYAAVATLRKSQWAILTNGKKWRLYTNKISASSTNYFEITLDPMRDSITRYLVVIFGFKSFEKIDDKIDIDVFFEEGKNYATSLEDDLSKKIMSPDGLFLNIVKGVLDHDMEKTFASDELEEAKQTALKVMYRIWFLAYAESRNLLPISDEKYRLISLQSIRNKLDSYEADPSDTKCWSDLLDLFGGVRNGSVQHNLPQYNGALFSHRPSIDNISIRNEFIVSALHGLLESDGEAVDYASLGVRHLGNIFESLMEFGVHQAEKDLMLLVDKNGIREVETRQQSTYSYLKNDLYLASKGGIALRKTTASFYTPNEIVEFLVWRGLEPILVEREKLIGEDLSQYKKNKTDANRQKCMDRLLDIQVLDPAMGSGHFLVEALNRITTWVTDVLKNHPDHPLLREIESDRQLVLSEQKKNGIIIDDNLLTHDVLLKRKIMKRCIFGVDLNPMAVELTKLSLWLDSFAIGVPLTYMDHHIKLGDSTIGMFLDDLKNREMYSLDNWLPSVESNKMICDVICSSDITIKQAYASEDRYQEHVKSLEPTRRILDALAASRINPKILPKKAKNEFIHKFSNISKKELIDFINVRRTVNELSERHRFFHWELEMMDAFTDTRKGFDLIVGNPPWEVVETSDDEFFTPYHITFKSLKPNTKKKTKVEEILKNPTIKQLYEKQKNISKGNGTFYKYYKMQGKEDKDMSLLVLERASDLVSKNGIISMLIPAQILTNIGAINMRKHLLNQSILSLYVFENKKKIFPIHSSYRFALLSVRNTEGSGKFPVGFYLHDLQSLHDSNKEKEKFHSLSIKSIRKLSPDEFMISEIGGSKLEISEKIFQNDDLRLGLRNNWNIEFARGFNPTYDAHLLDENGKGWPVFKGKNIHQYNHMWNPIEFTTDQKIGLKHESVKKIFAGKHREFYNSYRLVFRDITSPSNMRTFISTIIPPRVFHTESLRSIIFLHDNKITLNADYYKKIAYLCGMFNSLVFDFAARTKGRMNMASIIKSLPFPPQEYEDRIIELVAKLVVGSSEFTGFAESFRIPNMSLSTVQRMETIAEIDALVAISYDLTKKEYQTIIASFTSFKKNPRLCDREKITWNNSNLKEFYGEMAKQALGYFETITEESK